MSERKDGGAGFKPRHWKALQWFADHGPAHLFRAHEPDRATRAFLEAAGCIDSKLCMRTAGPFGWAEYAITAKGRALLSARVKP